MITIAILKEKLKIILAHKPKLIAGAVVVLALSLPFVINQVLQQQDLRQRADSAPAISFSFSPATRATRTIGDTFDVDIVMNTATNDIGSLEFPLKIPIDLLSIVSTAQGDSGLQLVNTTTSNGITTYLFLNSALTPVTGSTLKVATIKFKTLAAGTATVTTEGQIKATTRGVYTYVPISNQADIQGMYTARTSNASDPTPTSTPTPTTTPTTYTCEAGEKNITLSMNKSVNFKFDKPISSIALTSGDWCAWAAGNNDPNSQGRCPLKCPQTPDHQNTDTPPLTISTDKLTVTDDFDAHYRDNTGSCTYKVTCGNTEATATPTNTPSSTNTPTPTATPIPTVTVAPNETALTLALALPGIGNGSGDNNSPKRTTRQATVIVYDSSNTAVTTEKMGTVTYNATTGRYEGTIGLGDSIATPSGSYIVKVKMDNTLLKRLPGIVTINKDQTNNTSPAMLVSGDINQDNTLGIEDYTSVLACYNNAAGCTQQISVLTDINDNGEVVGDTDDYQILQRGFAIRNGD